ncbi:MAG: hypothetical protein M1817_001184 [Caeruleum heppii]|nr:MAG: hypothetical protein M1817_001184 [Caeruleum heppii]
MSNLVDQNISSTPDVDVANSDGGLGSTHAQEEPPPSHLALEADFSSFVYLAFAAAHAARPIRDLPSYLKEPQSVASSVVIGHGRSFFVSRKTAPAEPERQITNPLDGMTIGHTVPARPARVIVYKLAQVEFDKAGIPVTAHRTKFASVLLDLLALSHPPLIRHPNIVTLLGLAWSENQVDEGNRIPVPILEYADKGTLDRLERTRSLSGAEKRRICLDVANAIAFVHQCGIIHGDIKSENILMFSGSNYRYTAKLCDFGSSVIGGEEYLDFAPKGTKRWAAPEVRRHTVTRNFLPQIDVYAFGLLAWRLALDGTYPLIRVFVNREEDSSGKSLLSSWLAGKVEDALDDAELDFCIDNGIISKMALKSKWTVHHLTLTLLALPEVQSLRPILEAGNWSDSEIMEKLTATISSDHPFFAHVQDMLLGPMSLYSAIDGVLKNTLHPDPSARNLVAAIAALTRADEQSHMSVMSALKFCQALD